MAAQLISKMVCIEGGEKQKTGANCTEPSAAIVGSKLITV